MDGLGTVSETLAFAKPAKLFVLFHVVLTVESVTSVLRLDSLDACIDFDLCSIACLAIDYCFRYAPVHDDFWQGCHREVALVSWVTGTRILLERTVLFYRL